MCYRGCGAWSRCCVGGQRISARWIVISGFCCAAEHVGLAVGVGSGVAGARCGGDLVICAGDVADHGTISRFGTEAAEVAEELLARVRMVGARIGMGQRGRVGFGDGRLCAIGAVAARSPSALAAVPGPTTRARRCALVLRDRRCRPLLLLSMR
jgi:hypothetical protein